ncbi:MAG: ABC transporter permease [Bacteroidetes bacterium]|jgi:NitT/TauT family transport system permease protein|nr:ABC transporter permease [Bacteroidota bacterium]
MKRKWLTGNRITIFYGTLLIIIWECWLRLFEIPVYLLPKPSGIVVKFIQHFPLILEYTWITGIESFGGFFVSIALGIPLSLFIAFSDFLRKTLYPSIVALQLVPKIALAPLFVTWFGFGMMPKFIIVFLLCFFPILLNAILGFTSLRQELQNFALSTGADPLTVFWKVRLPAALPQIFVGFKWAAVNATVGATIGEWIGGDAGLGYYIQIASGDMKMDLAFAIIVMLAFLGLVLYFLVVVFEKILTPWHVSQRSSVHGGGMVGMQ